VSTAYAERSPERSEAFRRGESRTPTATDPEFPQNAASGPNREPELYPPAVQPHGANASRDVAISCLRLANLDNDIVDRLSRYEATLWRQLAQTLFTLQALKRSPQRCARPRAQAGGSTDPD
jgi:hypothetical protein